MDLKKLTSAMKDYARLAQAEWIEAELLYASGLSNSVNEEGGFTWYNPTTYMEDDNKSPKARYIDAIDHAWIEQKVDALIGQMYAHSEDPDKVEEKLFWFYDFVEEKKGKLPKAYNFWKQKEAGILVNIIEETGSSDERSVILSDFYLPATALAATGVTFMALNAMKDKGIPVRQNGFFFAPLIPFVPAILTGLGISAAVIGIPLLITKASHSPAMESDFANLGGKLSGLKDKVNAGKVFSGDVGRFYSDISYGTTMRVCAPDPDLARTQAQIALYAAAYATGDKAFADVADSLDAGWFGMGEDHFDSFETASVKMNEVMQVLASSPNQLVKKLATDFALIMSAACMKQTERDINTDKSGGSKACEGMSTFETIIETMEGLFMFGGKPCMYTEDRWKKIKYFVYIPTALVGSYYAMPIIKPVFSLVGSGLEALADKARKEE